MTPDGHTCGTSPEDVKAVADLLAKTRAEGYALAVANLRDDTRYTSWWTARDYQDPDGVGYWKPWPRRQLADYLEAVGPDGPAVTSGAST